MAPDRQRWYLGWWGKKSKLSVCTEFLKTQIIRNQTGGGLETRLKRNGERGIEDYLSLFDAVDGAITSKAPPLVE